MYDLQKRKDVKKPATYYLINLCVSDLYKVLINMPFSIISSLHGRWMFNQASKC